jgi:hypothetical protein
MVAKILSSTGSFSSVRYNTDKIDTGKGELMAIKNINHLEGLGIVSAEAVKDYFKAVSNTNKRVSKPQFHCAISCKGKEFNKNDLTDIAHKYMSKMGYEKQPYVVVFHNDTENNHVHIISTRIGKDGKKISDSNERYRSKSVIDQIMSKDYNQSAEKNIKEFFDYKISTPNQFKILLERNGFVVSDINNSFEIYRNGVHQESISKDNLKIYNDFSKDRNSQIKGIISKYSKEYSKELTPIYEKLKGNREGKILNYESELTRFLKSKFGLDFIFHHSENKPPFGYTLIDNKDTSVLKGSSVFKLNELIKNDFGSNQKNNIKSKIKDVNLFNINDLNAVKLLSNHYKIPHFEIKPNNKVLDKNDDLYYKSLLDIYFKNNDWNNIHKLNIIPVIENEKLYLIDKSGFNIVEADHVLSENIVQNYFDFRDDSSVENNESMTNYSSFDINIANDVDDEKTHGKERNKSKKR